MIKNILIPLDGSEHSTAALDYGMWMAEKFNGTLFGQHVIDTISIEGTFFHDISGSLGFEPYLDFSTKMREVLDERGKIILEDFRERCRNRGIKHQTFLDMGLIANEICERAKVADLVIIGHRGVNEEFSTGLLGTTAETHYAQMSPADLCLDEEFKAIDSPLLAYDGSQRASSAMESAAEFCTVLGLPLDRSHHRQRRTDGEKHIAAGEDLSEFLRHRGQLRDRRAAIRSKRSSIIWPSSTTICSSSAPMATGASSRWLSAARPSMSCAKPLSGFLESIKPFKVQRSRIETDEISCSRRANVSLQ